MSGTIFIQNQFLAKSEVSQKQAKELDLIYEKPPIYISSLLLIIENCGEKEKKD